MTKQNASQTLLILVMFGISIALFLLLAMRGRLWWGILAGIGSYLLLFWLTAPYLARTEDEVDSFPDTLPESWLSKSKPPPPPDAPAPTPPRPALGTLNPQSAHAEPRDIWLAEVVAQHGDAVYGRRGQYAVALYYGRVTQGAVLQLLALKPVRNEFGSWLVAGRVLFDSAADVSDFGTAVWLKLDSLSIAPHFRPQVGTFDLDGLRQESDRLYAHYEQYQPPTQISQPPTFPKGLVTARFGTAVYGHEEHYDDNAYLTRLTQETKLLLRSPQVETNNHNIPIILIELIAPASSDQTNLVGWVSLTDTTFADYYDPETATIHN